jgi:molecular chaperone DnaK
MEPILVGIDLGTTYSTIAYVDERGLACAIPNADGVSTTPSVVLIEGSRIEVGQVALNQWLVNAEHVCRWIKRAMGDGDYLFQGLDPVAISAEILKSLNRDAEVHFGRSVDQAVITCPAYFTAIEIENTKRAGERAGLTVREIVKEPTAAAVYYGVEHMRDGETTLVCDLGGGTYDATVLTLEHGVFVPRASKGSRERGGHDWTMALVELVAQRYEKQCGTDPLNDVAVSQMLYEDCERAKRQFKQLSQVSIPCSCHGQMASVIVTRDEFEAATEWLIRDMVEWSDKAVAKAGLTWPQLDRILLVGGSSRLRRMGAALREQALSKGADLEPTHTKEPDLMVAFGAAIMARGRVRRRPTGGITPVSLAGLAEVDVRVKRIAERSLGTRVVTWDQATPRIANSEIIPYGAELPAAGSRDDYELALDHQSQFNVPVVQFEDDERYEIVGNYRFRCPPGVHRADRIQVTFSYDVSEIADVTAVHLPTGEELPKERLPYEEPEIPDETRLRLQPRWVIFAIDTSGSMDGAKLQAAKQALTANARELLALAGDRCQIGLVSFDAQARVVCRPTSQLALIERAVSSLTAHGTTAMDDGIQLAIALAAESPAGVGRDVVMLTDGMPDAHRRENTLRVAAEANGCGVVLSSLGVGSEDVDLEYLQALTPLSLVIEREDMGQLSQILSSLLTQTNSARQGGGASLPGGGIREVPPR